MISLTEHLALQSPCFGVEPGNAVRFALWKKGDDGSSLMLRLAALILFGSKNTFACPAIYNI